MCEGDTYWPEIYSARLPALELGVPGAVQGLLQIQHQLHLSLIIHNTTRGSYTAQAAQREIGRRPRPRAIGSLATAGNYWFGSRSPACIFPSALVCAVQPITFDPYCKMSLVPMALRQGDLQKIRTHKLDSILSS